MRRLLLFSLTLVFVLPCFLLLFSACSGWNAVDFGEYDYFAMTDANGKEYVYAEGEEIFSFAASAFSSVEAGGRPAWLTDARSPLLVEWIRNGHALQYHLYLHPETFSVFVEDADGNGAYVNGEGSAFFLSVEASRPSLRGDDPPSLLLNGDEVEPSICSWSYTNGERTVSSGDYLNRSASAYPLNFEDFVFSYAEEPASVQCTVYREEEELLAVSLAELRSALAVLADGEYQLVTVCLWQESGVDIRAGYSFAVSIP